MNNTLHAIQYNNGTTPVAIGTITEDTYKMLYDYADEQTTVLNKDMNRLDKTLTTTNYPMYLLARQLHRESLVIIK